MTRRARRRALAALLFALVATAVVVWRMPEVAAWSWRLSGGTPVMTTGAITLSAPLHWLDDYYAVADLGANAYAIGEPRYGQCNFSYLIVGSNRALLFDTGPGLRDIRPVVRSLTALPVVALPSHLHFDHVGDLSLFEHVALPDLPDLRRQARDGALTLGVYQHLGFVEGFARPTIKVSAWIKPDAAIDLGDRELTLVSVPGHTPDSVVLLDRRSNRLFAGDFIYPSEIYAFLPGANLRDYAQSAGRLLHLTDEATSIYGAHGCDQLSAVDVPILRRSDVAALAQALDAAGRDPWHAGRGWYPRRVPVNDRMTLLAKFPWMSP